MSDKKLQQTTGKKRLFGLSVFAIDNATSIFLLTFMLVLFGLRSYLNVPKEAFPEIPFPKMFINTAYPGSSAEDMENLVTRPLEQELGTISEVKTMTSSSMQDFSLIIVEFDTDVDMEEALRKVKDAVDKAKPDLPNDLPADPEVIDVDMSEIPIMTINLSGRFSNDELRSYAEYLQDEIESLPEISAVNLQGARERQLSIEVDIDKMQAMKVSFRDIENAIKAENVTMSGGELEVNHFRRTLRIVGEFKNPDQIRSLIVKSERQNPVVLGSFAKITFGFKDPTSLARANGLPVISLGVIKRGGENLLSASDKIKEILKKAERDVFPEGLEVSLFNDMSINTRRMVANLENNIISGIILVVLVLLFFLGLRNSMFVGLAIPLSMFMGFLIIHFIGYTLNMVVLFSLILALGMLVDNAIVVVENIYRYMQNGYTARDAARYGVSEVAVPIITSTATTLAAFLPMAFWPGLMGSFMRYLPITLIIVLSSSLFVALVINPVFTASFMKVDDEEEYKANYKRKRKHVLMWVIALFLFSVLAHFAHSLGLRNILWFAAGISLLNFFLLRPGAYRFQASFLPRLERGYDRFIRFALSKYNPLFIFFGSFVLLVVTLFLLGINRPKVDFFPETDPDFVNVFVELPIGYSIEATDSLVRDMEQRVMATVQPYGKVVESVLSQIGENTGDPSAEPVFGSSPNRARLTVAFVPYEERGGVSTMEIMEKIRDVLKDRYPDATLVVDHDHKGPPTGKPINIEIRGDDIPVLLSLGREMIGFIQSKHIPGIEELRMDVKPSKPQLIVNIDREAARRYGISTFSIADLIRTAVFGKEVSKYKQGDEDYPIWLQAREDYRHDLDKILAQRVTFRNPSNGRIVQVPVSAVVDVKYSSTYNSVNRKNQKRMVTVYSNVLPGYNKNEVVAQVKAALSGYPMPKGFSYAFTGEQEEQAKNTAFLQSAFMAALFLIFLIIVGQFNSLISPFIILSSVLLSTIGVFLGYLLTGMDIVIIMTGMGIISLAGIVVNNAIVLIDYTNLLVKEKREALGLTSMQDMSFKDVKEAIVQGGATRLRPVLLTAITTVLGLLPMAVGMNVDFRGLLLELNPHIYFGGTSAAFWGVMAWTVIFGLVFATFLTLIVVPVMYWLAFRLKRLFYRRS